MDFEEVHYLSLKFSTRFGAALFLSLSPLGINSNNVIISAFRKLLLHMCLRVKSVLAHRHCGRKTLFFFCAVKERNSRQQ